MKSKRTTVTYLQMLSPPAQQVDAPTSGVRVVHIAPSVEQYLELYRDVGGEYHWVDRLRLATGELKSILNDSRVDVFVLTVDGDTAGFGELDRRKDDEIEVAYFGLMPGYIGRGLGKYFLNQLVQRAWQHNPRRVWLHTCTLDHPAALPNYLKAGFVAYDEETIQQAIQVEGTDEPESQ